MFEDSFSSKMHVGNRGTIWEDDFFRFFALGQSFLDEIGDNFNVELTESSDKVLIQQSFERCPIFRLPLKEGFENWFVFDFSR